jgi:glycosyltransferase involved in cell wall biosynthesis
MDYAVDATHTNRTPMPRPQRGVRGEASQAAGAGSRRHRVLFLHPGTAPPHADPRRNMLYHLSQCCEGDLVTTRWKVSGDDGPGGPVRFETLGDFGYHATRSTEMPALIRTVWNAAYTFWTGLRLSRRNGRYDVIVAYGPYTLSMIGWTLKLLTGARLVVEVPGPPTEGFVFDGGLLGNIKLRLARRLVPFLLRKADGTRLYYSWQLDGLPAGPRPPAFVFPDFVPVSLVPPAIQHQGKDAERYVLFLGYPFNRKGVDVLIQAFDRIAPKHPDVILRIVGYCPDPGPWERMSAYPARVRIEKPLAHEQAMDVMAKCAVFALPSRMEGVPRVLIEALAARRAVVSTRVSGIPALIEHEHDGLLSDMDDIEGLAKNLDRLLSDSELGRGLGENGHRKVLEELTEERFVQRFADMLQQLAVGGRDTAIAGSQPLVRDEQVT